MSRKKRMTLSELKAAQDAIRQQIEEAERDEQLAIGQYIQKLTGCMELAEIKNRIVVKGEHSDKDREKDSEVVEEPKNGTQAKNASQHKTICAESDVSVL